MKLQDQISKIKVAGLKEEAQFSTELEKEKFLKKRVKLQNVSSTYILNSLKHI